MNGFPTYPTRSDFGPELRDLYPPENPETDIGADQFNLLFHQVAGLGLANPVRACLIAKYNTGTGVFEIYHQEEAWNPKRDQARPTLTRQAPGIYFWGFPSTVLDRHGNAVPLSLVAIRTFIGADGAAPVVSFTSAAQLEISISGTGGTSWDDRVFWVEVA